MEMVSNTELGCEAVEQCTLEVGFRIQHCREVDETVSPVRGEES